MDNFVCENAKNVWRLFEKTGYKSLNLYSLYNAIQYGKYKDLYIDESFSHSTCNDGGLEL
jgi:hypothetical protein